ncbi:MAG TPA: putative Fe-S cluster assembly protein SufT [Casimicrobiaceae bacterium]|jgi:probable FeS assembly SUF system protein SufT|nr:putative Fe-S cluster assembly protein SufT [Casimicrobiaceae bacterium]
MRANREAVTVVRAVQVECVPDGTPFELPAGTIAHITQALGSNFTLVAGGQLVRLRGIDADAIGREVPTPAVSAQGESQDLRSRIQQVLKTCFDPEIPVDIVELGLVYGCDLAPMEEGGMRVEIRLTLTAPGCGMGEILANEVADKVLALEGVGEANVQLVLDPPWDRSRMSEAAQLALGL